MSLIMTKNESIYDILLQSFVQLIETIPTILKLITVAGGVAVTSYALYHIHVHRNKRFMRETKHNSIGIQEIRNYNRSFIRNQSIISHKEMFHRLEYAADNCYDKTYALTCIDIIVYCPQLINVKSSLHGLTPFHRVCLHGHTCLITFMLGKGADASITAVTGENALCLAVHYFLNNPTKDDFSCLEILQNTGCGFGIKNRCYNVLLRMAVTNNHIKLMQWLILHKETPLNKIFRCSSMPPITYGYKFNN